ncbi:uncharacterized protein RAG0_10088 [Rhynchosporium agropyri]|uniref:Uncharacterized protein n=1 Tax=Rhynchosporium agropyri TaxID=914238 RepID=A0A1E1KYE7_9HELO|nr:uncharacterized protein RAG0_10088 [Rhynchosporium agropyri]
MFTHGEQQTSSASHPHPKRQLDKAGASTAAIINVARPQVALIQEGLTKITDGDGTSDRSINGQQVGQLGAQIDSGAGNLVPLKATNFLKTV